MDVAFDRDLKLFIRASFGFPSPSSQFIQNGSLRLVTCDSDV